MMYSESVKRYEYDQLSEEAKQHAQNTVESAYLMSYDIEEEMQYLLWSVEDFNNWVPAKLFVFDAHGPATEQVAAHDCSFFDAVEYLGTNAEHGHYAEIAEAYNKHIDEHSEELAQLLENIEAAADESENTPMGIPDYAIYEVISLQDQFARIFDEALEAAASAANEIIEGIKDMYADEYEREQLLNCFYWTEEGEYIEAL